MVFGWLLGLGAEVDLVVWVVEGLGAVEVVLLDVLGLEAVTAGLVEFLADPKTRGTPKEGLATVLGLASTKAGAASTTTGTGAGALETEGIMSISIGATL